jgi:cytochrome c oxidase subunit IV
MKSKRDSPYSSVVERQSCKLKVRSSILRGGNCLNDFFFVFFEHLIKQYIFLFSPLLVMKYSILWITKKNYIL